MHPTLDQLRGFLAGHSDSGAVERHVLHCPECCQHLDDIGAENDPFEGALRAAVSGDRIALEPAKIPEQIGDYRILREIGRGGMGVVYEAEQVTLKRRVALKLLGRGAGPEEEARFLHEARVAAKLHHTNIVPIYGVGDDETGPYLVMQCIDGTSLDKAERGFDQGTVTQWGIQAASALAHAHALGVLHRDVKPGNLLLDSEGNVWLTDFGLAKSDDRPALTQPGDLLGTLRYMAPEVFDGKTGMESDQYALGLTLYELLAGRPAYQETDRSQLVKQITSAEPPRLDRIAPQVPRDLVTVVHKAIDRDPARRYDDMAAFAADLQRVAADEPIHARRMSTAERFVRWCRHNPSLATSFGIIALMIAAGVVALTFATAMFRRSAEANATLADQREQQRQRAERQEAATLRMLYQSEAYDCSRDLEGGDNPEMAERFMHQWFGRLGLSNAAGWEWRLFDRLAKQPIQTMYGSGLDISAMAWSPDSKRLATAGFDRFIRIWDAATGRQLMNMETEWGVSRLEWSQADDKLLVATDKWAIIYDVAAGVRKWKKQMASMAVGWRPDGQQFALGLENEVVLYAANGQPLTPLRRHEQRVWRVAWHPDGKHLASGDLGGRVIVWDVPERSVVTQRDFPKEIIDLSWTPSGQQLAVADGRHVVTIVDADLKGVIREFEPIVQRPYSLDFHPDGTRLAIGTFDSYAQVRDVATGELVSRPGGHGDSLGTVRFSPDGKMLATAGRGWNATVKLWDAANLPHAGTVKFGPADVAIRSGWSTDGQLMYLCDGVNITVRGVASGNEVWSAPGSVTARAYSPDGSMMAGVDATGRITFWEGKTGRVVKQLETLRWPLRATEWSADGQFLAVTGNVGKGQGADELTIWDVTSGQRIGERRRGSSVAIGPEGQLAIGDHYAIWLVEMHTGRVISERGAPAIIVEAVAWNPARDCLAATIGQAVAVRDVKTHRTKFRLLGHTGLVRSIAWAPDGDRIATASDDSSVRLWDAATGQPILTLKSSAPVTNVSWSPDGNKLLASGHGHYRVWDATAGAAPQAPPLPAELTKDIEHFGWWVVDAAEFKPEVDPFVGEPTPRWYVPADEANGYVPLSRHNFVYVGRIHANKSVTVDVSTLGSINPDVWLNGEGVPWTNDQGRVALKTGWNTIAVRVINTDTNDAIIARPRAGFYVRVQEEK